MADNTQEFPTILGPDAVFKGELTFEKGLRLQGKIDGKVTTNGRLHVAKEARLAGEVSAGSIIVEGDVEGNLTATDRIELKQSARYRGDLTASKLVVDEGAIFSGHVTVGPDTKGKPAGAAGNNNAGVNRPAPQNASGPPSVTNPQK